MYRIAFPAEALAVKDLWQMQPKPAEVCWNGWNCEADHADYSTSCFCGDLDPSLKCQPSETDAKDRMVNQPVNYYAESVGIAGIKVFFRAGNSTDEKNK